MASAWPIIVVTGANGGIGFGICERFLLQLSQAHPPDAEIRFRSVLDPSVLATGPFTPCEGLTLVMACRSQKRADAARADLLARLDRELERRRRVHGPDAHAVRFRANLRVEFQYLDLALLSTVFTAAIALSQKYPYVSHLVCNAGLTSFSHIDFPAALAQIARGPIQAVTLPRFNVANVGERSVDGLGWVWQCNLFAHFALFRSMEPLLTASVKTTLGPARVVWMSSIEASPEGYDPADWQLLRTPETYALSKFQTDLLATRLDSTGAPVRHMLVQPGVVATSILANALNWFTTLAMLAAFYIARWLGSPHHVIDREKAALAFVHISLVPLAVLDAYRAAFAAPKTAQHFAHSHVPVREQKHALLGRPPAAGVGRPARFGSEVDWCGHERVGMMEVREWGVFAEESERLLERFDELVKEMREAEAKPRAVEGFKGMGRDGQTHTESVAQGLAKSSGV